MGDDKADPSKKDATISSTDAAKSGELTEEQLNSVSGGDSKTTTKTGKQETYITIPLKDANITSY